ncbi:SCO family protein [Paraburkholderia silvatlantica]|uniref:Cytochrome oxidase Cu insertion factor (SCO1/SenC/PrrC family) n=1 Tax=Paraburkholderia silvatlantica TaxID=321895 RepID=A0ABR6FLA0_9BURK|nr:cytochrome C oxidase subunit I [Paraburkholderia silvatlantica]MBB2927359.1 cytochrome oxidase Cu insertion factor (SCO1/SenC/PrrC family) [Paraburkholderia silvatlantica]
MSTQSPRSAPVAQPAATSAQKDAHQDAHKNAKRRGRWTLLIIALICGAPIAISYFTYYVIKPKGGTTSYGALIEPQRPIPGALMVTGEDGHEVPLASLKGRWLMISANGGDCDEACATKLYFMRQVRATQGPERERIVTVWLRTDDAGVPAKVKGAYADTRMLRADPVAVAAWLPATPTTKDTDHIYLVDPNGNLMMRFPAHADPSKIKQDVTKLLKWSRIG